MLIAQITDTHISTPGSVNDRYFRTPEHLERAVAHLNRLDPRPDADLSAVRQAFVSPEPYESVFDYSYDAVMRSYESSLARLRRDRIDILYAHDIGSFAHGAAHPALFRAFLDGGYRAMRELRQRRTLWNRWSDQLAAHDTPSDELALAPERPVALPEGPIERYADRAWAVALGSFGVSMRISISSGPAASARSASTTARPAPCTRTVYSPGSRCSQRRRPSSPVKP